VPSYTLLPRRRLKINLSPAKILADEKKSVVLEYISILNLYFYDTDCYLKFREEMLTKSVVL